jgi:transmembrane sensor
MSETANAHDVKALAADWRDRKDREDWSAEDQAALDAWLAQSSAHMVAYLRVDAAWTRADRLSALRGNPTPQRPAQTPRTRRTPPMLFRMAAAAIVLGVAGYAASDYLKPKPTAHTYATAIGGSETIRLSDGSRIELNTDTVLRTEFRGNHRFVALEKGEAYFDIVHDAQRPLIVQVGRQRIVDLGTQFSVHRDEGRLEVKLVEGRAQFEAANGKKLAVLTPGDVLVKRGPALIVTRKSERVLSDELSWRRGMLTFLHTPLSEVAHELNRYNRQKIVIADASVARLTMNGAIPATSVSAFTNTARDVFGLKVETRGNEIVISH